MLVLRSAARLSDLVNADDWRANIRYGAKPMQYRWADGPCGTVTGRSLLVRQTTTQVSGSESPPLGVVRASTRRAVCTTVTPQK